MCRTVEEYDKTFYVQVDQSRCHACHTCTEVCPTGIIDGKDKKSTSKHTVHHYDGCVNCGQCLVNCPYGAIQEQVSFIADIEDAINDKRKTVVAIYKEYLEHPNSHLAHKLLHTHYIDRSAKYKALKR